MHEALNALEHDTTVNLKKAHKGTTTAVINIQDKINGQIQMDKEEHYKTLALLMIVDTLSSGMANQ